MCVTVSARIAGFSATYHAQLRDTAVLPCVAVGKPDPLVTWKKGSVHGRCFDLYINTVTVENRLHTFKGSWDV